MIDRQNKEEPSAYRLERCYACEGSGTQPSYLYLIPFWPTMLCRLCNGSGAMHTTQTELFRVYAAAAMVLRHASIGDQNFVDCLQGDDAEKLRLSIADLRDAFRDGDEGFYWLLGGVNEGSDH